MPPPAPPPTAPPLQKCEEAETDEEFDSGSSTESAPSRAHYDSETRGPRRQPPRDASQNAQNGPTTQQRTSPQSAGRSRPPSSNHAFPGQPFSGQQNSSQSYATSDRDAQSFYNNPGTNRSSGPTTYRQRPPSPPESIYPEHESNETMPWLEIANLRFAKHAASIAEHFKFRKCRQKLERLSHMSEEAWDVLRPNRLAMNDKLKEIQGQAEREGNAAGWAYMMHRYMELDPAVRWTAGLAPLPEHKPESWVYSSLGTLAAYKYKHGNNPGTPEEIEIVDKARKIVATSAPADEYERARLTLSQYETMVPVLKRRGFELPPQSRVQGDNLNWSQWKRGTDDKLINRYFPYMVETLTEGRSAFIPFCDPRKTFTNTNRFATHDPFGESYPHSPSRSSQYDAGDSNTRFNARNYGDSRGSGQNPSARKFTANPSANFGYGYAPGR